MKLDDIRAAAARILSNTGPDSLPPNTRADAVVLARAWVELLSREPTGRVEYYRYVTMPDRDPRVVLTTGNVEHFYELEYGLRLAADLLRAAEVAEVGRSTREDERRGGKGA